MGIDFGKVMKAFNGIATPEGARRFGTPKRFRRVKIWSPELRAEVWVLQEWDNQTRTYQIREVLGYS
jgi:hypothetical protein